jgi:hypothetical protein
MDWESQWTVECMNCNDVVIEKLMLEFEGRMMKKVKEFEETLTLGLGSHKRVPHLNYFVIDGLRLLIVWSLRRKEEQEEECCLWGGEQVDIEMQRVNPTERQCDFP